MFKHPAEHIVQSHHFDIYEDVGCFTSLSIVLFTFPLIYGIPSLIGLVSVVYGVLTVRTLGRRRRQFEDLEFESHGLLICVSDFKLSTS